MKIGLICSSGGHLARLWRLHACWSRHQRFWVTFDRPDARVKLEDERVYWARHPTNRHPGNLLRNAWLASRILPRERPDVLVSTGAGVAVPFFAVGRALGIPLVYMEVLDRLEVPSLSARLVRPLVDVMALESDLQQVWSPEGVPLGEGL